MKGWREDTKGGRTQREGGHEGRKDTKGGRTRREGGHEGRKCCRFGYHCRQRGRAIVVIYREGVEIN